MLLAIIFIETNSTSQYLYDRYQYVACRYSDVQFSKNAHSTLAVSMAAYNDG